jgi:hypothetical protein
MIKQLHAKSIPTNKHRSPKPTNEIRGKYLLHQIAKELLSPRPEAIEAILAKAALNR